MLGSKNRDFKTSARSIKNNLKKHFDLMQKYISQGLTKEDASKKAYKELFNG